MVSSSSLLSCYYGSFIIVVNRWSIIYQPSGSNYHLPTTMMMKYWLIIHDLQNRDMGYMASNCLHPLVTISGWPNTWHVRFLNLFGNTFGNSKQITNEVFLMVNCGNLVQDGSLALHNFLQNYLIYSPNIYLFMYINLIKCIVDWSPASNGDSLCPRSCRCRVPFGDPRMSRKTRISEDWFTQPGEWCHRAGVPPHRAPVWWG